MSIKEDPYQNHLKELHASGFEMANGEPDIKGWLVIGVQNQEIGKISEILFDEISQRVRYLVMEIDGKSLNLISRSVLVPIGLAELHPKARIVFLPGLTVGHIASLPTYERGKVTFRTERAIRTVFAPTEGIAYEDEDYADLERFYNHDHPEDDKYYPPKAELRERTSVKEEIKDNIEKLKTSVRKIENDLEKFGKKDA
jgi:PRC-barrel domain